MILRLKIIHLLLENIIRRMVSHSRQYDTICHNDRRFMPCLNLKKGIRTVYLVNDDLVEVRL